MARIKQSYPVFHPVPLCRKLRDFCLTLVKKPRMLTPGQQSAWSGHANRAKHQQRNQRN